MFELILDTRPYFFSLREIPIKDKTVISLDIKIPAFWEYKSIVSKYSEITVTVQDKSGERMLLSLVSQNTSEVGFIDVFNCSDEILKYNKEEEEKRKLFKEKMDELSRLFKEQTDELKNAFKSNSLSELKNDLEDGKEKSGDTEGTELVEKPS